MKKIILIIFLFISFTNNVYASTYYSDYKYIGTDELKESDEIKYEEIKLYNTYTLEYKDLGYIEDNNLYIKDENDYIEKEYYIDEYIEENDELVVIPSSNYQTCSIKINNFHLNTKISEIELIYNDKKIDYKFMYNNISNSMNIKDNDYNTYATILSNKAYIRFETSINFSIHKLKLIIHTIEDNIDSTFDIILGYDIYNVNLRNNKKHIYTFNNIENIDYKYLKNIKLYRHYEEVKVKNDIYVVSGDNLLLDDYKYVKKYYKRDKLVLSDNNIINNTYNNLNSFIKYSSGDVIIDCNINYSKNGIYKCLYKLNDIEVIKDIIVRNNENKVEIKEDINNKDNIDIIKNNKDINKIKPIIKNNTKKEEKKNESKVVYEIKNNNIKTKDKNYLDNIIKYIIILFMICIEIILFIKRKRKNVEKV